MVEAVSSRTLIFSCWCTAATAAAAGIFGLPKRSGNLKDLTKFDASFFGVHPKQANVMDPQLRMLLEVTYEALLDSGDIGNMLTCYF